VDVTPAQPIQAPLVTCYAVIAAARASAPNMPTTTFGSEYAVKMKLKTNQQVAAARVSDIAGHWPRTTRACLATNRPNKPNKTCPSA
jgi:hypothetical protein